MIELYNMTAPTPMMNLKNLWKHIKRAKLLYQNLREREIYNRDAFAILNECNLLLPRATYEYRNPTQHIGTALEMAKMYGLELTRGSSYGSVRAELPREKWVIEYRGVLDIGWIGWVERGDVCKAVCDCLMNCYEERILCLP